MPLYRPGLKKVELMDDAAALVSANQRLGLGRGGPPHPLDFDADGEKISIADTPFDFTSQAEASTEYMPVDFESDPPHDVVGYASYNVDISIADGKLNCIYQAGGNSRYTCQLKSSGTLGGADYANRTWWKMTFKLNVTGTIAEGMVQFLIGMHSIAAPDNAYNHANTCGLRWAGATFDYFDFYVVKPGGAAVNNIFSTAKPSLMKAYAPAIVVIENDVDNSQLKCSIYNDTTLIETVAYAYTNDATYPRAFTHAGCCSVANCSADSALSVLEWDVVENQAVYQPFSCFAYFRIDTIDGGVIQQIINKRDETNNIGYYIYLAGDTGYVITRVQDGSNAGTITSEVDYRDGNWHTVGMAVSRTGNTLVLYIDGEQIDSVDISAVGSVANGYNLTLGASSEDSEFFFRGQIAYICVLSVAATLAQFNQWAANPLVKPANCVGFWPGYLNNAGDLIDFSGNEYDGTLTGVTQYEGIAPAVI